MSFNFIEIEEKKNHLIFFLVLFLIAFYFFTAWLLIIPCKIFFLAEMSSSVHNPYMRNFSFIPAPKESLIALVIAAVAGTVHWYLSLDKVIDKMLAGIGAGPFDDKDVFHRQFRNITDEAAIAAGGKKIECYVIPTSSLNAFALSDFAGRNVIGITEGLLARLNRAQLETVIGHELAHIVSGDCRMTTVICSLFSMYSAIMDGIKKFFKSQRNSQLRGRKSGNISLFLALVYVILAVTRAMSMMLNLFISRQREYRADAIAVRLTRNPLALAEALRLISRGWRGMGLSSEYLANVFILNPNYSVLDETDNFFSNIFSTHPPIRKRIDVLLGMAHIDEKTMNEELAAQVTQAELRSASAVVKVSKIEHKYFAVNPAGDWQGPFALDELKNLAWMKNDTWIKRDTENKIKFAWQDDEVRDLFQSQPKNPQAKACPKCKVILSEVLYEGTPGLLCNGCGGYLLSGRDKISRILVRKEQEFSPELIKMAEVVKKEGEAGRLNAKSFRSVYEMVCPLCSKKMQRCFYNLVYPVEIDNCFYCGAVWFEKNGLEILQYLVEKEEAKIN